MPASNTKDCFREFVGQRVIGLLFDALPVGHRDLSKGTKTLIFRDLSKGTKTLIFEDRRGLTIAGNGSYWIDTAEEIERAVSLRRMQLEATERDLREVIEAANADLTIAQ